MLLWLFDVNTLDLLLGYPPSLDNDQYMMDDITMLPHVEKLFLLLSSLPHAFGACVFHVLRMCTGVRKLSGDRAWCQVNAHLVVSVISQMTEKLSLSPWIFLKRWKYMAS